MPRTPAHLLLGLSSVVLISCSSTPASQTTVTVPITAIVTETAVRTETVSVVATPDAPIGSEVVDPGSIASVAPSPPVSSAAAGSSTVTGALQSFDVEDLPAGEPGEVSVLGYSEPQEGSVHLVMRNNTGGAISQLVIDAVAYDATGAIIGSRSSSGSTPALVPDGEIVFMSVNLGLDEPAPSVEFAVEYEEGPSDGGPINLTVSEVNATEDGIFGRVTNDSGRDGTGATWIEALCFDGQTPTHKLYGGEGGSLTSGKSTTFSAPSILSAPCYNFRIGATG